MRNFRLNAGLVIAALVIGLGITSCTDLTVEPKSTVIEGEAFTDPSVYRSFLAKLYAGLAVTGQRGPDYGGDERDLYLRDIEGIDEGFGQYIRGLWQLQELPTDEAVIGWGDAGLPELVISQWASTNQFVTAAYYRIFFQIALANEFLHQTTDEKLAERGHQGIAEIPQYRAEARFLRALSYWHGLDLFGKIPFVTETPAIGSPPPEQVTRGEVFDFIESELTAVRSELPGVGAAEYGRADQGALSMLLAKLYMNAEVYGVGDRYADAMAEIQNVISGPYSLDPDYQDMFLADNDGSPEFIFTVPFDGERTQTWGGTTFLAHAALGGSMNGADYGISGEWWGLRVTPEIVGLYEGGAGGPDSRADIFYTDGQNLQVNSLSNFNDGYAFPKYKNITSTGQRGSNTTHVDIDYPMFRLADAYLMYAEAHLRGGGGDAGTALGYVNAIRQRAYGDNSGDITPGELTLDFMLDERGRELIWEGHRRTDLIRYGLFTGGDYVWAFKGGSPAGDATADYLALYPIPASELIANPNLEQNLGY